MVRINKFLRALVTTQHLPRHWSFHRGNRPCDVPTVSTRQARPWGGAFYQHEGMCRDNSPLLPKEGHQPLLIPPSSSPPPPTTSSHSGLTLFRVPQETENLRKCRRHISARQVIHTKYCTKIQQEEAEGEEK